MTRFKPVYILFSTQVTGFFKNPGVWALGLFSMFVAVSLPSCDDPGNVGMELLPSTDLVRVSGVVEISTNKAYQFTEDSVRTDEASTSLLGTFNDPLFGKTTIDLAAQFRLNSFPNYGSNPVADSIRLYLYYRSIYGDTSSVQKLEVYELNQSLDIETDYYQFTNLSELAYPNKIGEVDFRPKVQLDSTTRDTLYQLISIPLNMSLAQKLITADSLNMINNETFLEFFKGLYVKSAGTQGTGAIASITMLTTSTTQGSGLVLYYHNDEDTTNRAFYVTSFSASVNSMHHDYSQTTFFNRLNKETTTDSLIYIQSTGGLKSKVYIPSLDKWKDSANIAINKAELVFKVDTTASQYRKYPMPMQLYLRYIEEDGSDVFPVDYTFYPNYYGGFLYSDYTYRFNITHHLKQIMKGDVENRGFYLAAANKNGELKRVVVKGSSSAAGIKLVVTYSKLLQ